MRRRRDDPDQSLFRWVWFDPTDDCADDDDDDDDPPAPLAARVRARHAPRVATLWGVPVAVARSPERSGDRLSPERKRGALEHG